jgi:hypothetical protein
MKILLAAIAAVLYTSCASATQAPKDCSPKAPKDPPVVSRPEPKAPAQSRESSSRNQTDLCSRWPTLVFCTVPEQK